METSLRRLELERRWALQREDNARQLTKHTASGGILGANHWVSHVATFPGEFLCKQFCATIQKEKFAAYVVHRDDTWRLVFARTEALDKAQIDLLTRRLVEALLASGGAYHGWTTGLAGPKVSRRPPPDSDQVRSPGRPHKPPSNATR